VEDTQVRRATSAVGNPLRLRRFPDERIPSLRRRFATDGLFASEPARVLPNQESQRWQRL
jgi:hypothetical protein